MNQWYHSALCGHALPTLTDNWTHGAAIADTPSPQNIFAKFRRVEYINFEIFYQSLAIGGKRYKIASQLLRDANRKPYALYRTVTFTMMTFSDLWRSFTVAILCALLTRDLLAIVKFVVKRLTLR